MHLLLFVGTGGAGTTTVAAATALHAARRGVKTLLLAPEPGAGPAHATGFPAAGRSTLEGPVEVEPGLFAHQVDARARARRGWQAVGAPLAALLEALGVEPLEEAEFTGLPGLDDVLALLEIRDAAGAGWDLVVVDTPGLARTLRLLALPEAAVRWVDRMLPIERRMLWAMGHGASPTGFAVPDRGLVEAAERCRAELADVRQTLTAPAASVRLVMTAQAEALRRARHARAVLALHGMAVGAVVVNRLVPGWGEDPWRRARAAAQTEVLADAEAAFAPLPVARLAERPVPPATAADLVGLAQELPGEALPHEEVTPGTPGAAVERSGADFVLVLPLPLARRDDLELSRRGDELVVDLAGERRVLALPSVLRRCEVIGATLRGGALRVGFRPDPALWRPL